MVRFISQLLAFAVGILTTIAVTSPRSPFSIAPADVHRTYGPNGNVDCEQPLDSEGLVHGDMKYFWPSGRLKSVVHMHHGQLGRGIIYSDLTPDDELDVDR